MKLAISNIAWKAEDDGKIYELMQQFGFSGLEIAPTRIFQNRPYEHLNGINSFSNCISEKYNLQLCSMQSIWFGRLEQLFGQDCERLRLVEYTKKAIDFAEMGNCNNLVFGSPKNRNIKNTFQYKIAKEFFNTIGNYAKSKNVFISIEANPTIYGTNFINTTSEAFKFCKYVDNTNIGVNVDLGTIIENKETLEAISDNISLVNHVHISEPYLNLIKKRDIHKRLAYILLKKHYNKFISIEMKRTNTKKIIFSLKYVQSIFK